MMKKNNKDKIPSSSQGGRNYKRINLYANMFFTVMLASTLGYNYYEENRKAEIYNALFISFNDIKEIEYGDNFDTLNLVENVDYGDLTEYTKEVDTSTLGLHRLSYEVSKEDISKEFTIDVMVKDTKLPIITLKKDNITIYVGNNYDLNSNVESVTDEVDGSLEYSSEPKENGYYTINSNFNKSKTGTYNVVIDAFDKNGNTSSQSYTIKVIEKPKPKVTYTKATYTSPASVDTSSVVNAAKSFLGYRYVYGGHSPSTGFDCSGFVYYIYSLFGKSLARSASGIAYNGNAVSRSNIQPGDIIVWSTNSNNSPTHVSLFIGGDKMIHAANRREGVIISSVSQWESHGGGHIVTIRRV